MNPADVGAGVVSGGEVYVWAAYGLSWLVLGGYVSTLWLRAPRGGTR